MTALRLITVPLTACDLGCNPRSARDPGYCHSLGLNIRAAGQKVPIIGFFREDRFQVADGGCRVEGMRLAGLTEVLALDWGQEPTPADLLMAHASIDLHKQYLPPLDRARLFRSLLDARGCTAKQLSLDLGGVSESLVGRYLSLLTLPPDLQEQVNAGTLEFSKACLLAQETDPVRQRELAAVARDVPRDALAKMARRSRGAGAETVKQSRVSIPFANGTRVVVSGQALDLELLIVTLQSSLDAARRAQKESLDIKTFEKVAKDKAKAG